MSLALVLLRWSPPFAGTLTNLDICICLLENQLIFLGLVLPLRPLLVPWLTLLLFRSACCQTCCCSWDWFYRCAHCWYPGWLFFCSDLPAGKPAAVPGTGSTAATPAGTLADYSSVQICLLANLLLFLGLVLPLRPLLVPWLTMLLFRSACWQTCCCSWDWFYRCAHCWYPGWLFFCSDLPAGKPAAFPGTGSTAAPPAGTMADYASVQICLLANLLLFLGLVLPLRPLLVPWLTAHSLLCLALACAFFHYLGR